MYLALSKVSAKNSHFPKMSVINHTSKIPIDEFTEVHPGSLILQSAGGPVLFQSSWNNENQTIPARPNSNERSHIGFQTKRKKTSTKSSKKNRKLNIAEKLS